MSRRANQPADNRTDRGGSERNPSGVAAAVVDVVNDMMPRRRRRAMRTMPPPMTRRGHRRTSRQNHTRHKNRECLDDLEKRRGTDTLFALPIFLSPLSRIDR